MRVIAGSAKRLQLKTIEGMDTRPTTDRIKETLFNMITPSLYDCRFLDLCAGSGGIGIEALSRGAKEAVFVEKNPKAVSCIKENLKYTKLDSNAQVVATDVLSALARLRGTSAFGIIFMDPPYNHNLEKQVLASLNDSNLVDEDTLLIVEASKETTFDDVEALGYSIIKEKLYKTNKHVFLEKTGGTVC